MEVQLKTSTKEQRQEADAGEVPKTHIGGATITGHVKGKVYHVNACGSIMIEFENGNQYLMDTRDVVKKALFEETGIDVTKPMPQLKVIENVTGVKKEVEEKKN